MRQASDSEFLNDATEKPWWQWSPSWKVKLLLWAWLVSLAVMTIVAANITRWADGQQLADGLISPVVALGQAPQATTGKWTAKAPTGNSPMEVFIRQTLDTARAGHDATGWPVSLEIAQWYIEHNGYLPDRYVGDGYNLGHSVPFDSAHGTCLGYGENSDGTFCYAATLQAGLAIWEHVVLNAGYYGGVAQAAKIGGKAGDKAAAKALGESPWAGSHYDNGGGAGSSLAALMDEFNLYFFDR